MIKTVHKMLFMLLLVFVCNVSFGQTQRVSSVKIEIVDFNTETITRVTCEDFDFSFTGMKEIKIVRDSRGVSQLVAPLTTQKQIKSRPIDVRGKITYNYGKKADTYCFNIFGEFYKGSKLYFNKQLLIAICDKVYGKHEKYLDTLKP